MSESILGHGDDPPVPENASGAWPQLVLVTTHDMAAVLEEALFTSGAVSVIYRDDQDQPILEPAPGESPLWDSIRLTGLYPQGFPSADAMACLSGLLPDGLPQCHWELLQDEQWERRWEQDFKPMQFSPGLWICPSHCDPVDPQAINVRLDPGLAFGTGTHATTQQCLEWVGRHDLAGCRLLDYGCGSGVLGIAAALSGASHVVAVDIDPQALSATQNNAASNQVLECFSIGQPDIAEGHHFDVVLANILYQPLLGLAPVFAECLLPGGRLVMSGILLEQIESLRLHYNQWFVFKPLLQHNDWALLYAIRRDDTPSVMPSNMDPDDSAEG